MNTPNAVVSAVMSQLAKRRWKKQGKRARAAHASKMGKASAEARARKSALTPKSSFNQAHRAMSLHLPIPNRQGIVPDASFTELGLPAGTRDRVRELVRIRDHRTCQLCGRKWKKGERRLDVHHLDEEQESTVDVKWDRENLHRMITLCHKCHLNLDTVRAKMRLAAA
jgi:5-methylcytosine-specific restriction endonuclease McrA